MMLLILALLTGLPDQLGRSGSKSERPAERRIAVAEGWEALFHSGRDASGTMVCDRHDADQLEREFWHKYRLRVSVAEQLIVERFGRETLNEDRIVTVPCYQERYWFAHRRKFEQQFLEDLTALEAKLDITKRP
ncbi:hypothetical protein [Sphingomonas sp. LaA6.9]|uniref:hypothetical protein n=1 Tax=Sphingomonas sp. LaA6.9 TaxID=2919914 RepID=UPI001F4F7762|nr:hypothetical protein [Sphingomonas sp. LaA6.9]MCJ8159897.1 hypothetical protein [Sphingomonas sp. LaA6.9]